MNLDASADRVRHRTELDSGLSVSRGGLRAVSPPRRHIESLLREAIIRGEFVPGSQLRQEHLSELFGVSPTPIREALRHLETEGLVVHFPNRGVFVADVSKEELLAVLLPVRFTLEKYALASLPTNHSAIAELEQLVGVMEAAAAENDFAAASDADLRFHEVYIFQCGTPHIVNLWRAVHSRIRMYLHSLSPWLPIDEIPAQHRELLELIKSPRRRTVAESALEQHIMVAAKAILAADER